MPSFLDRYSAGDCEQVWRDLVALGPAVRSGDVLDDARSVAAETMRLARTNLERLVPRLRDIGYAFAYTDPRSERSNWYGDSYPVLEPPDPAALSRLDQFEKSVGPVALSVRAWYEQVGAVNLIGTHDNWPDIEILDPLVVGRLGELLEVAEEEFEDRREEFAEDPSAAEGFGLQIAPDDYHKADISGGPPYTIPVPSAAADAPLLYEWHNTTFVNYLRIAFRWAGFPGFERIDAADRPAEHLAYLTKDLWPL